MTDEEIIDTIAAIRKDNRSLWLLLGYARPKGDPDPVPGILRTVIQTDKGRAALRVIAENDRRISVLTKKLADEDS